MTKSKTNLRRLKSFFYIFIGLYILNLIVPLIGPYSYTERMWVLASLSVGVLSIYILATQGLPEKKILGIGISLGILAGLVRPFSGVITVLAFLAAMKILRGTENKVEMFKKPLMISILFGGGIGLILGIINLFLGGNQVANFAPSFYAFLVSLNPGIFEEVAFRFFVYAFTVYLLGGRITDRKERRWVYVLMIIPHVLLHFPDTYFVDGFFKLDLGALLINPTILSLLFGLPMTLLMVKRDLASAIITHTVVDFIRFVFLGLPF